MHGFNSQELLDSIQMYEKGIEIKTSVNWRSIKFFRHQFDFHIALTKNQHQQRSIFQSLRRLS